MSESVKALYENPRLIFDICLFGISGFVGVFCLVYIIGRYSAVLAMILTSCRKVISLSLSYWLFPKPLTIHFIFASILVFGGVGLHTYSRVRFYFIFNNLNLFS